LNKNCFDQSAKEKLKSSKLGLELNICLRLEFEKEIKELQIERMKIKEHYARRMKEIKEINQINTSE